MLRGVAGCALALVAGASSLHAQTTALDSAVGQRVRSTVCGANVPKHANHRSCVRTVGELVAADATRLHIRVDADSVAAVERSSIRQLERSAGMRRNTGTGALVGAGAGAGLGLLLAVMVGSQAGDDAVGAFVVATPLALGALGAGVGAAMGSFSQSESWAEMPADAVAVRAITSPSSLGLAVRVRFGR